MYWKLCTDSTEVFYVLHIFIALVTEKNCSKVSTNTVVFGTTCVFSFLEFIVCAHFIIITTASSFCLHKYIFWPIPYSYPYFHHS